MGSITAVSRYMFTSHGQRDDYRLSVYCRWPVRTLCVDGQISNASFSENWYIGVVTCWRCHNNASGKLRNKRDWFEILKPRKCAGVDATCAVGVDARGGLYL